MLIKFLTGSFRTLVGFAAWGVLVLGLAVGAVVGVVINNAAMHGANPILPVATALIGLLMAFVAEVVIIPPFMVLFTIDARVKFIESELKDGKRISSDLSASVKQENK